MESTGEINTVSRAALPSIDVDEDGNGPLLCGATGICRNFPGNFVPAQIPWNGAR